MRAVLKTSEVCSCLFNVLPMLVYKFKVHLCKRYLKKLPCSVSRMPSDEQKPQQTLSAGVRLFFCWRNLHFQLSWLSTQNRGRARESRDCFAFIIYHLCWCTAYTRCPRPSALFGILYKVKLFLPRRSRRKHTPSLCLQGCEWCTSIQVTAYCYVVLPCLLWGKAGWSSMTHIRVSQINTG